MDLQAYYRKIREKEAELAGDSVVVISLETTDGGRAGVSTEVRKGQAARLVVDGKARVASEEEAAGFRAEQAARHEEAEEKAAMARVQLAVMAEGQIKKGKGSKS